MGAMVLEIRQSSQRIDQSGFFLSCQFCFQETAVFLQPTMDAEIFGRAMGGWLSVVFPAPALSTQAGLGETEAIRRLLAGGADIEERGGILRTSPLQWAARNGQAAVVLLLLEFGADVSAKDKTGWTALHWSAYQGREEISLLLLQHGAEASVKDYVLGETPVELAASQYHHQLVAMLKAEAVSRAKCVA